MRIASALIVFLLGCGPDPAVIAQQEALLAAAERMIQAAEQALSKEDFRAVSDSLEAANQALYRADHKSLKDKVDTLAERIHRIGESNAALEKKAFEQSKSTFAGIIAQIEPLARGASAVDKPRVRGKILLWDGKNGIYPPHHQLPANLRATKPDDKMTIFLLGAKDWEYVGDYVDKKGGEPVKAYRHS